MGATTTLGGKKGASRLALSVHIASAVSDDVCDKGVGMAPLSCLSCAF